MIRLLINGAKGRMGKTLVACAAADPELIVSAEIDEGDDFQAALECGATAPVSPGVIGE